MISTVSDFVEAMGGTNAVAAFVSVPAPSVSRARNENRFPGAWRLPLYLEAQRRGIAADPALFGLPAEGAAA
jgi:hypothetical protein